MIIHTYSTCRRPPCVPFVDTRSPLVAIRQKQIGVDRSWDRIPPPPAKIDSLRLSRLVVGRAEVGDV